MYLAGVKVGCEGSWHGMASVYTILTCHDPGIQKERRSLPTAARLWNQPASIVSIRLQKDLCSETTPWHGEENRMPVPDLRKLALGQETLPDQWVPDLCVILGKLHKSHGVGFRSCGWMVDEQHGQRGKLGRIGPGNRHPVCHQTQRAHPIHDLGI